METTKKLGVCISGGGARIGFAVGVLKVMEKKGINIDLAYGISAGSICTAALCYGNLENLERTLLAIRKREDVLKTQLIKMIWTQLTGWGKADGLITMNMMRRKLNEVCDAKNPKLKGVVGYVNLQNGQMELKGSDSSSKEEFLNAVQASCSLPMAMQSQRIEGHDCVDGAVRDVLPLGALLRDAMGVNEIHVICLIPPEPFFTNKNYRKIEEVAERTGDLMVTKVLKNNYDYAGLVNKLIAHKNLLPKEFQDSKELANKREVRRFRYLPKIDFCGPMDFCTRSIQDGIRHGHEIASAVLKDYPNGWE